MGDKKLFSDCFDRYVQLSGASAQAGGVSLEERTQMTAEMMQAASQIGLDRIQLFTQRGLYVRRLLEAVGAGDNVPRAEVKVRVLVSLKVRRKK